ncbi:hypothetical protein TL16_g01756 [Triparma laevis f. inornata]|uniref:Protein root UVB sensitive/RUS domain-containing protein n=1 Tax=Triparma laevis f. inornata TaxID=1714386 RepID=A0A9W6ZQM8_9STRA|nr:hypothetical protein TL16_g01756 [Triparma laevis f. inornata]
MPMLRRYEHRRAQIVLLPCLLLLLLCTQPASPLKYTIVSSRNLHSPDFQSPKTSSSSSSPSSFTRTFVPSHKTPPNYGQYVAYNQVQNLCTSLRNTLSTLYILSAFDRQGSNVALTATLTFLSRDGAGMISTLLFARYTPPFSLQTDVKRWRYLADITCNVALICEFLSSYIYDLPPAIFTATLCATNAMKACCGMMAGASAGPIDFYWAGRDVKNLPDLSSKSAAQGTFSNGLGLILGAILSKAAAKKSKGNGLAYFGYFLLTVFHLLSNARMLRAVAFNFVNYERLVVLVKEWKRGVILSPSEVAKVEPLLFRIFGWGRGGRKLVGVLINEDDNDDSDWEGGLCKTKEGTVLLEDATTNSNENAQLCKAHFVAMHEGTQVEALADWAGFSKAAVEKGWDFDLSTLPDEGVRFVVKIEE